MPGTVPTRLPEKMSDDRRALDALLDDTVGGHVAFVADDGSPAVLPTAVVRSGDRLVVHGSTGSRWRRLVPGAPAAVSVAEVDGVIVARSAFESSLAYRSAVVFGSFEQVTGDDKALALDLLTERASSRGGGRGAAHDPQGARGDGGARDAADAVVAAGLGRLG